MCARRFAVVAVQVEYCCHNLSWFHLG